MLECYLSYLHLNGDVRFQSGRTDTDHGGWFSAHLDAFTHGLQHSRALPVLTCLSLRSRKDNPE